MAVRLWANSAQRARLPQQTGDPMKDDVKRHKMADAALRDIAAEAAAAFNSGARQVQPFSARYPDLTMDDAYRVTALANDMRIAKGYRPVGRKIGFTNRRIWDEYGVRAPIWGYVYDRTLHDLAAPLPLAPYSGPEDRAGNHVRPRRAPSPGMDDTALLTCIDWVAHGYEIVQSIYPELEIRAARCTSSLTEPRRAADRPAPRDRCEGRGMAAHAHELRDRAFLRRQVHGQRPRAERARRPALDFALRDGSARARPG